MKAKLIEFEKKVADAFAEKRVKGPVHLSGGNEDQLIEIFKDIHPEDWVFCSYRNHYHALLHGVPEDWLFNEILEGRSMNIHNYEHRFFTSAIVGGPLPIAVGVAAALKRQNSHQQVWCFVGDMAATIGAFHEANSYVYCNDLPLTFVVEDNRLSCNSPTDKAWGGPIEHMRDDVGVHIIRYEYDRQHPHVGIDRWVQF